MKPESNAEREVTLQGVREVFHARKLAQPQDNHKVAEIYQKWLEPKEAEGGTDGHSKLMTDYKHRDGSGMNPLMIKW